MQNYGSKIINLAGKGKNDECYTMPYAIVPLLPYLEKFKGQKIWCPFDTQESEFVKILTANGHDVIYSHISLGMNFFEYEPEKWDLIVSNPPFTGKTKIFERCINFNKPFALIMSNSILNDPAPMRLFKKSNIELLLFTDRMVFSNQKQIKRIPYACGYFCHGILPEKLKIEYLPPWRMKKEKKNETTKMD